MKSRSRDGLAAKGLLLKQFAISFCCHSEKYLKENCGHVTPATKGPLNIRSRKEEGAGRGGMFICSKWALCSWGHVTTIFLKIFYIMGYNLKNARNGNSISKISKWQSLRSLAVKNEIL